MFLQLLPKSAIALKALGASPIALLVNRSNQHRENLQFWHQLLIGIKGIIKQQIISGVRAGETVITQGQNRLVDGTPVRAID